MKDYLINLENGDKGLYTGHMRKLQKKDDKFVQFIPHGKGSVSFNKDKDIKYDGYFKDGHFHGKGMFM